LTTNENTKLPKLVMGGYHNFDFNPRTYQFIPMRNPDATEGHNSQ